MSEIETAVQILRNGGLVAFPTETVYGLGADARNPAAIHKVFLAKNRPFNHPLIVHIADPAEAALWGEVSPLALQLMAAFWPGPLTLILPKKPHVLMSVTGHQETVALRMPAHPLALDLIRAFGSGLVAPSANQFTHVSPTTSTAVREELGDQVDLILDGGACRVGLESTIVDVTTGQATIRRLGMVLAAELEEVLQQPVYTQHQSGAAVPGLHQVHYAPRTKTRLVSSAYLKEISHQKQIGVIHHSPTFAHQCAKLLSQDPQQYAQEIYRTLRAFDQLQLNEILIEDVPDHPAWVAIKDRLLKASAR